VPKIEWSFHQDPDLIIDTWSTAGLIRAGLEALLEEPEAREGAITVLSGRIAPRT
jgi:hypothetical protein